MPARAHTCRLCVTDEPLAPVTDRASANLAAADAGQLSGSASMLQRPLLQSWSWSVDARAEALHAADLW